MSNTAPAKQVRKPKKLPFVIMCILSAIVAVLNVLLCVLVPKYYTTINSDAGASECDLPRNCYE